MAGNVREWVLNESATGRYVLGGAWSDPTYSFNFDTDSNDPWARLETNGLRCARYSGPLDTAQTQALILNEQQQAPLTVSDELYEAYSRIFKYDKRALDARVDERREDSRWRYEFVSFDAAYGGERVMAHLFLPLDAEPPYQAVVWFPGNDAFLFGADGPLASPYLFDFIPESGRALVYPIYKGSYQRTMQTSLPAGPNQMRDLLAMWSKDLARTLDYLEQRDDIDAGRTAYYGFSAGAVYGPIFTAIEQRFAASILLGGGSLDIFPEDTSHAAFAPRSTVPTLMINGVDDFIMPFATAQTELYELLGSAPGDKRHARLDGGHIPSSRQDLIAEIESWLDERLGPVTRRGL
jgi:predicted esterase